MTEKNKFMLWIEISDVKNIHSPPLPVDVDTSAVKFEQGPNDDGMIRATVGSRGFFGPTTTAVVPSAPTGPK